MDPTSSTALCFLSSPRVVSVIIVPLLPVLMPELWRLRPIFTDWPAVTIPVFVAMMFGATLGGNATLIGAAANVVAAGICGREGRPIKFKGWLRYGIPITLCQLAVGALYVLALFHLLN
jgi:Na+/H+ antiporter NhaD/arsenite permease-like protein